MRALLALACAAACAPIDPAAWSIAVRADADVDLRPSGHEAAIGWAMTFEGVVTSLDFVPRRTRLIGESPVTVGVQITTDEGDVVSVGAEVAGPQGVLSSPPAVDLGRRVSLAFGRTDGFASAMLRDDRGLVFAASEGDHTLFHLQDHALLGPGEREGGGFDHPCGRARWYDLDVRADSSVSVRLGEMERLVVDGLDAWVVNGGTWRIEDWRGDCEIPRQVAAFVMGREG